MKKGAMEEQDDALETISYSKNISRTRNTIAQPKRLKKKCKAKAKKKYSRNASAKATTDFSTTNGIYAYDKYELAAMERGWDSLFAQNLSDNVNIIEKVRQQREMLSNIATQRQGQRRPKSASAFRRNLGEKNLFVNKHKRANYYGSGSRLKNKTSRRPQSAGHLRRAVTTGNLRSRRRTDPLRRDLSDTLLHRHIKEREMNMSIEEPKQRNKGREKYVLKRKIPSQDTLDRCKNPYRQPRTLRKSKEKLISTRSNDSLAVDAEAKIENANVELSFQDKCKKIKSLWKKLRIPIGDRKYFSGAFMVAKSEINEKFIDEQIDLLQRQYEVTIQILKAIGRRESAVSQLVSIAKAASLALITSQKKPLLNIKANKNRGKKGKYLIQKKVKEKVKEKAKETTPNRTEQGILEIQTENFRNLVIDRCRRAQMHTVEVIDLIKDWRANLWRPHPFGYRGSNYILKIGHCEGLKNMVKNPDALAALKQCKIESKELILLLPQHIRNEICSQPLQMQMKDDNVNPATSCTTSCPTIEGLNSCEEYVRLEKMLQVELQEELRVVRTRGYFIPRMKWNPNNLQSQTTTG